MSDDDIIDIRRVTRSTDFVTPFADTIAFARAIEARVLADIAQTAARARWWRQNMNAIEEDDAGLAGLAYSYQIPLADIQRMSEEELMDAVADAGLRDEASE